MNSSHESFEGQKNLILLSVNLKIEKEKRFNWKQLGLLVIFVFIFQFNAKKNIATNENVKMVPQTF